MHQIFRKYVSDDTFSIGIGMGRTMSEFSHFLPSTYVYYAASLQTQLFLTGKTLLPLHTTESVDLYFDSADAYDQAGNLIKGGGGALALEKLLTRMARRTVIVVEKDKQVSGFDNEAVPVEILKESLGYFRRVLDEWGIPGALRLVNGISPLITDNGNFIVDVRYNYDFISRCKEISGVVEHGFFPMELGFMIEEI